MKKVKVEQVDLLPTASVPEVLTQLNEKIASLKRIEESVYKTNGEVEGFSTNIKEEMKIENLIRTYSSVKMREAGYLAAVRELGLTTFPAFVVGSGSPDDWKHDIMLRIDILTHKETLDKLNGFKEKMGKFLSEQDQKAMLLKEMQDFFSK